MFPLFLKVEPLSLNMLKCLAFARVKYSRTWVLPLLFLRPPAVYDHFFWRERFVVKMYLKWTSTCQTEPATALSASQTRSLPLMSDHLNLKLPHSERVPKNKCLFIKVDVLNASGNTENKWDKPYCPDF